MKYGPCQTASPTYHPCRALRPSSSQSHCSSPHQDLSLPWHQPPRLGVMLKVRRLGLYRILPVCPFPGPVIYLPVLIQLAQPWHPSRVPIHQSPIVFPSLTAQRNQSSSLRGLHTPQDLLSHDPMGWRYLFQRLSSQGLGWASWITLTQNPLHKLQG